MINHLKFSTFIFILVILNIGCKSLQKSGNQTFQLRKTGEVNKSIDISDLINADETTLICVRHAEKILDVDNPSLTEAGKQRAKDLATVLEKVEVDAIYSSDYNRTIETAQPLADKTKLPIQRYNPKKLNTLKRTILDNHHNEVVVVVGHSNTTPKFVSALLSKEKYTSFDESDYDNIYVVSVAADGEVTIRLLEYGAVSP